MHVAVVYGSDEIHRDTVGPSEEEMFRRLALCLLDEVYLQLWEPEVVKCRQLVANEQHVEAVKSCFARVGDRGDPQRLSVHRLNY